MNTIKALWVMADLLSICRIEGAWRGFNFMDTLAGAGRSVCFRWCFGVALSMAVLSVATDVHAICGLDGAALEQIRSVENPEASRALNLKLSRRGAAGFFSSGSCIACHTTGVGGPRNTFGNAVNILLTRSDREDATRQRDAGRRMTDILANPLLPDSPTFGEMFQKGELPAQLCATLEPTLWKAPARESETITVERAHKLVQDIQETSRWGILQLSRTYEMSPEAASALAEFRGEMLILGLRSLTPDVAAALAKSQAATLWLHSVTSVSPETAAAIVTLRGHLVLTSLAELDSVPLAEKLAARPEALSFPYLKTITPEIAEALARNVRSLTLSGLTAVSPEVEGKLAETVGALSLPNLTSLDSLRLTKKLAASGLVLLPKVAKLSTEQAKLFTQAKGTGSFFGGLFLSLPAMTEEVAVVLAENTKPINLTLVGNGPLSNEALTILLTSRMNLQLQDVESLSPEQTRIVAEALGGRNVLITQVKAASSFFGGLCMFLSAMTEDVADVFSEQTKPTNRAPVRRGPLSNEAFTTLLPSLMNLQPQDVDRLSPEQTRIVAQALGGRNVSPGVLSRAGISLPSLKKSDATLFAVTSGRNATWASAVTSLSPETAAALGNLPDQEVRGSDGTVVMRPSGDLDFPSLEELSPETARLLLKKRWLSISFPALQDVSLETVRLMARQTFRLNLGITALPLELADAFKETPTDMTMGGGFISFPSLKDVSPEAARLLVKSLNRGVRDLGHTRISNSPRLSFGGFSTLAPELAVELAKHTGILEIKGLGELPDEAAAAFASFPGPYLILSGPAAEKLSPKAAAALAEVPGVLDISLKELDSLPLAERFARQITWTLRDLETVSEEAIPALIQYKQTFDLRNLRVLESPQLAERLIRNNWGPTLPTLDAISPEAARIVATSSHAIYLGLTVLDSPAVARALATSRSLVNLRRLRAATPEVLAILKSAKSITTPPLETLYILSETTPDAADRTERE